jgi:Carboxypeptidase regulatory-like domain
MMKHKKIMYLLLVFVLAVALCGAFPTEVFAAKALKGTLSGVVLNQNGKPVSNTQVYIYQRDWSNTDGMGIPDWKTLAGTTMTSRNGQYKISLPAGEYRVWFVPQDLDTYAMEAYPNAPIVRLGDSVTVKYGRATGNVSVTLDASGKIGGVLRDTFPDRYGQPLPDTPIALAYQEYSYINCLQLVSTDENGYYEFKGLKAYPWMFWVNCPQFALPESTEPFQVPNYRSDYKNFFTSAIGPYDWLPLTGQTTIADEIWLEYNDFVNVSGTLVYIDNLTQELMPVVGMTVRAEFADDPMQINDWGGDYLEAVTDENGRFEIQGFSQAYGLFVLRVDGVLGGTQYFYDEYFDDSQEPWGAKQFDLYLGAPVNTGEWMLMMIPEGQNP